MEREIFHLRNENHVIVSQPDLFRLVRKCRAAAMFAARQLAVAYWTVTEICAVSVIEAETPVTVTV
jgi:hypothetical protein